ncbi:peptidylprolyl isomerase [Halomonas daqingensis]|uniref:SurA N-terminal domain-containing protein n=1 Tax=Billgrantia desiderata TaxID=52021 RepID=UPI000A3D15CE|nr:SurA N-terminal domain-containing protein [Halomonas desiderata]MCE8013882.1 peptidylprolyl isomerase [Halomonas desiderata]MCE8028444.1 peptidylprolyl isomerase [Halomonas desiderata]NIC38517.1 peptidylprolyl isomerase [Halomonas desiderata]OUE46020.1 peptidylprolyl isomerase [Halomonas desiderata SP1]
MRFSPFATLGALGLVLCLGAVPLTAVAQDFQPVQRQSLDRIVAVVNQQAIMHSQLEERMAQARSQLAAQGQSLPPESMLREYVLEQIILEEIQLQMAANAGLSVDDTALNRQMREIAESNNMTLDQFADALEADGLTMAAVREEIRREMLLRELHQRQIGGRVNVSTREVERFIEQQGGNVSHEQARQMVFQRKANEALDAWLQEIRADAFVDNRLASGS